jgi:putative iron-dependent peroxidase
MQTRPAICDQDLQDMQGLIGSGFNTLRHSEYLLLDVTNAASARQWLQRVRGNVHPVSSLVRGEQREATNPPAKAQLDEAWSIAFTYRGLVQLGAIQDDDAPFSSDFRTGQAASVRRKLLRDAHPDAPWDWVDVPVFQEADETTRAAGAVSILAARFYKSADTPAHDQLSEACLSRSGLHLVRRIRGCAASFRDGPDEGCGQPTTHLYEPFGFRDGVSQPVPQGLRFDRARKRLQPPADGEASATDDDQVPLGEFVLGHPNAYREPSHCPDVRRGSASPAQALRSRAAERRWAAFGRNGSYLAVRQIHQDVEAFKKFEASCPVDGDPSIAEKMLGRRKDGSALQTCPSPPGQGDALRFRMNDSQGFQCPLGAHVRRANPRDALADSVASGVSSSKLHRLLRRGRPYAACQDARDCTQAKCTANGRTPEECGSCATGLLFIALVADLARQFEFIQRLWIGNPHFENLHDSGDPIVGNVAAHRFVLPGLPIGTQVTQLPDFTHVKGGGYFFLPGLSALERLANGEFATACENGVSEREHDY